nr:DDE-type integrase/transposase/recombinase [Paenibacillus sp. PL91]
MDSRMKTELVSSALKQAIWRAGASKGLIVHSDRGVQYASKKNQRLLKKHDFACSMSRKAIDTTTRRLRPVRNPGNEKISE